MCNKPGVYPAVTSAGKPYFRSSITYHGKHLSLGSYASAEEAAAAYEEAAEIFNSPVSSYINPELELHDEFCSKVKALNFDKWIMVKNLKDNNMYCRNPIYMLKKYFLYFLSPAAALKFDAEDLFYYRNHKIMQRGGHLFVSEYGMQTTIFSRYGIKPYAVEGRDYIFVNGDTTDYRYGNIEIINRYHGVTKTVCNGLDVYVARVHINGNIIIGKYSSEEEAAIAYNKAVKILAAKGVKKNFPENYIDNIDEIRYARIYNMVKISKNIRNFMC